MLLLVSCSTPGTKGVLYTAIGGMAGCGTGKILDFNQKGMAFTVGIGLALGLGTALFFINEKKEEKRYPQLVLDNNILKIDYGKKGQQP